MRKPPQQTRRRQRRHQPRQRARAHFSENHALIFLAIVQPFYSSKPYHKSLHSCSLSLFRLVSRRHGRQASVCIVLIVFPRALSRSHLNQEKETKENEGESRTRSLIFLRIPPLIRENSPESSQTAGIITFVYHLRRACFRFHDVSTGQDSLIHKKRASKSFEERKKHTPRRRRRIAKRK